QNSELGDRPPCGHDSYLDNHWSGRISVTLTTVTPLLIPDAANLTEDGNRHKTYPLRLDADGKPYLPPTSIKGMLRSAYEAVTNSRLSIFVKHKDRLAFRMSTKNDFIPARVECRDNQLVLRLMEAPELLGDTARLLRYQKSSNSRDKG
ncbi:MAG: RAMP superfamily CRISPR-associated protein, partial [Sphaerospermopsis kisseleviana]